MLALMPDAFGGFAGIAQYSRDLFESFSASSRIDSIVSLTRHPPVSNIPIPVKLTERFLAGHSARYIILAVWLALRLRPNVILCGHLNLLPIATLLKKLTGGSLILQVHGIEAWRRPTGLRSWGIGNVDLVISVSRFTRQQLLLWSDIEPHRVRVVSNAVHLDDYSVGEKPGYLVQRYGVKGKLVLLTLGRLPGNERYKGQDRIIALLPKLAARFPNLIYMIVGDGSDRARLEGVVSTQGLEEYVIFTGRIPEEEKIDHYNLADAFAMPSTSEGFGFVFLEAAACGLPVLGGGNDGSRDALVDGRLGIMVDCDSTGELLEGLEEILQRKKRVPDCLKLFDFPRFKLQIEQLLTNL